MSGPSPPLRFLLTVVAGWGCGRALLLASPWSVAPLAAAAPPAVEVVAAKASESPGVELVSRPNKPRSSRALRRRLSASLRINFTQGVKSSGAPAIAFRRSLPLSPRRHAALALALVPRPSTSLGTNESGERFLPGLYPPVAAVPRSWQATAFPTVGRWSASAWSFFRQGGGPSLAPGGTLGAPQAGFRLGYRLNGSAARPLAVSARFASPLRRAAGAEAAVGLDWKPAAGLPLHVLAERRQAVGREGRSAFGLTVYGGVDAVRLGRFRLDAYGQAGVVGARSRDLFADGAARVTVPIAGQGRVRAGLGAWGAAQPGASRLDIGPSVSITLPLAGRSVTVAADWRLRAAGRARPGSGPALTLATDF